MGRRRGEERQVHLVWVVVREKWRPVSAAARVLAQGAAMIVLLPAADRIIVYQPFLGYAFWSACDLFVHGAVALVVAGPCIRRAPSVRRVLTLSSLALLAATVLDLDHFVSAGSLEVRAALTLAARPLTHSFTFALLLGVAIALFSRDRVVGWVAFAALASHVVRDAAMGTAPLLWPLPVDTVPWWAYACGELGLMLASCAWGSKVPGTGDTPQEILPALGGVVFQWRRRRKGRAAATTGCVQSTPP